MQAVCALLMVGAFFAGRQSEHWKQGPPTASVEHKAPQTKQPIVVVVLDDHLDRSERFLVQLKHADLDSAPLVWPMRDEARSLLAANKVCRQKAAQTGDPELTIALDHLDRLLAEAANESGGLNAESIAKLQDEMNSDGLLFEVRVLRSRIANRKANREQPRERRNHMKIKASVWSLMKIKASALSLKFVQQMPYTRNPNKGGHPERHEIGGHPERSVLQRSRRTCISAAYFCNELRTHHRTGIFAVLLAAIVCLSPVVTRSESAPGASGQAAGADSSQAPDSSEFAEGTRAINQGHWADAVRLFAGVAAQNGEHADAALYWKAYAEDKLGQFKPSQETCANCAAVIPRAAGSTIAMHWRLKSAPKPASPWPLSPARATK